MKHTTSPRIILPRSGASRPAARCLRFSVWQRLLLLLAGVVTAAGPARAATHTWSGAGANTNWSTAANWSSGGVPVAGESNLVLIFPAAGAGESRVDIAGLSVSRIEVDNPSGATYQFRSGGVSVTLNGGPGENFLKTGNGGAVWYVDLVLTGTNWFHITGTVSLDCAISGVGGLTKRGPGQLNLQKAVANTYAGTTRVSAGRLELHKPEFTTAFAGNLVVEGGDCGTYSSNQIPDNVSVSISSGMLGLYSATPTTETLGPLTLSGTGEIDADLGTIVLASSVNVAASADVSIHASGGGSLSLGGGTRIFNVEAGGLLTVTAEIENGGASAGSIISNSPGTLRLSGVNTFTGTCTVNAGVLQAASNQALGGTAGATVVQAAATLELGTGTASGVTLPAGETIQMAGTLRAAKNSTVAGSVVLSGAPVLTAAATTTLTHTGVLSGAANPLSITGPGAVVLGGAAANTYSGDTELGLTADLRLAKTAGHALPGSVKYVNSGSLTLLAAHQIPDTADVWMSAGGTFNVNGFAETIGHVHGSGLVSPIVRLGDGALTMNATSAVQLGTATAPASIEGLDQGRFIKKGAGTFTLYQNRLDAGTTFPTLEVQGGTVHLFDEWLGGIRVEGGSLHGRATTGIITLDGGSMCLCDFTTAGFHSATAGSVRADLAGHTAGSTYDRMVVNGNIDLTGQTLLGNLLFLPYQGSQFTLIKNNGPESVTGTFVGLPEGATVLLQGEPFTISYVGGASGRDVVLAYQGQGVPLPEITGLQKQASGNVLVSIQGPANTAFKLYHSTTLQAGSWTLLGTVTTSASGTVDYTHVVPAAPSRFYRLGLE
ncbi:MAG: autotransporter-associated beta strand repeat-containing protein [Verrucomicrobiales bacterium]|nr:autotransporter-associated beta strand repeat-containing protein [Verrucomicrobiales bacterium]